MNIAPGKSIKCPPSSTKFFANLFAITMAMLCLTFHRWLGSTDVAWVTQSTILIYAILVSAYEIAILKSYLSPTSGLNFKSPRERDFIRILTRITGFFGSIFFVGLLYWIFQEYHGSFYEPYWAFLLDLLPYCLILVPTYLSWIDAYQADEADIYFHVGKFFLLQPKYLSEEKRRKHFLGWIIKGFFFPLMYIYATKEVSYLMSANLNFKSFVGFYDFMYHFIFGIDVLVVSISYIFTVQLLDSHLRSPQPAALGWIFALFCYQPFWSVIGTQYLNYDNGVMWDQWLTGHEALKVFWGLSILTLITIYTLSTIAFGLRFSNLTNRGIITGGPYKWTKHPAYISKNLAWWLISIPFISIQGFSEGVRHCAALLLLNAVYFVRAKTEEKHLSEEQTYLDYSKYIQSHGLFGKLRNRLFLKT